MPILRISSKAHWLRRKTRPKGLSQWLDRVYHKVVYTTQCYFLIGSENFLFYMISNGSAGIVIRPRRLKKLKKLSKFVIGGQK